MLKNSDDSNIISGFQPKGNIDQLNSYDNFKLIIYLFFFICVNSGHICQTVE